jgi:hypothetical protein
MLRGAGWVSGFGILAVPRQQRGQLVPFGMSRDDALQHVRQPCQRIDVIQLGGLDQRRDDGPVPGSTISIRPDGRATGPARRRGSLVSSTRAKLAASPARLPSSW